MKLLFEDYLRIYKTIKYRFKCASPQHLSPLFVFYFLFKLRCPKNKSLYNNRKD